jgi:hypothetical protein
MVLPVQEAQAAGGGRGTLLPEIATFEDFKRVERGGDSSNGSGGGRHKEGGSSAGSAGGSSGKHKSAGVLPGTAHTINAFAFKFFVQYLPANLRSGLRYSRQHVISPVVQLCEKTHPTVSAIIPNQPFLRPSLMAAAGSASASLEEMKAAVVEHIKQLLKVRLIWASSITVLVASRPSRMLVRARSGDMST